MNKKQSALNNEKGQVMVEMVLLLVVMISVTMILFKTLKEKEFLKKQISSPWVLLSGMIECGVWAPCGLVNKAPALYPGNRVVSFKPKN